MVVGCVGGGSILEQVNLFLIRKWTLESEGSSDLVRVDEGSVGV